MTEDVDALVGVANPLAQADVEVLAIDRVEADLVQEIMSTPQLAPTASPQPPTQAAVSSRWLAVAASVAAVVTAAVFALPSGRDAGAVWAAELLEVARSAPRIVVDDPAWSVVRADEFTAELGEMTFSDGLRELDVHWRPAATHADYVDDRRHSADLEKPLDVLGHAATLFRYEGGGNEFTTLWVDRQHSVEARGGFSTIEEYEAILGALRVVDVDTWLSAMPDSVVRPSDAEDVIAQMLDGLPLPDGFDASALSGGAQVRDRYQLGARVAGAVACAWLDQWVVATASGDQQAVGQAVAALGTAREWPILLEMDAQGDYPEVVWEYADAVQGGGQTTIDRRPSSIAEGYGVALACSDR